MIKPTIIIAMEEPRRNSTKWSVTVVTLSCLPKSFSRTLKVCCLLLLTVLPDILLSSKTPDVL